GGDWRPAAAILGPAILARLRADRVLLAVRDRVDPRRRDAKADKILFHGVGPARTESEVVFARASFVTVSFDGDANRRILREPCCLALKRPLVVVENIVLDEIEMDRIAAIDA